jgi:hypothetical protein
MTNEGTDLPVRCQKNEESLIPVYRPVRSGLTGSTSTGTGKEKNLPVPSLAPCDFWLFDLIKRNLDDQDDSESLYEAVIKFMMSLKKEEYKKLLINGFNECNYV